MTNSADDAVEVKPSSTSLHTQLVRFISVGVFTAAIDYGLTLLLTYLGLHRSAAKAIGWVFGTIAAYLALSLIHISEPTRLSLVSRMPSSA